MPKLYAWNGSCAFNAPLYPGDQNVQVEITKLNGPDAGTAVIYSTAGGAEMGNPFFLTGDGKMRFFAKRGEYKLTAARGQFYATIDSILLGPIAREKTNKTSSYSLTEDDDYTWVETTGSNDINITIPAEGTLDLGDDFDMCGTHYGTGALTFTAPSGGTLVYPEVFANGVPQYGTWGLTRSKFAGPDIWVLFGTQNLAE